MRRNGRDAPTSDLPAIAPEREVRPFADLTRHQRQCLPLGAAAVSRF